MSLAVLAFRHRSGVDDAYRVTRTPLRPRARGGGGLPAASTTIFDRQESAGFGRGPARGSPPTDTSVVRLAMVIMITP